MKLDDTETKTALNDILNARADGYFSPQAVELIDAIAKYVYDLPPRNPENPTVESVLKNGLIVPLRQMAKWINRDQNPPKPNAADADEAAQREKFKSGRER
jgi:hypothetical protein